MYSRSNLCHSNVSSAYYVSKKYLNNLTFNIPKIDFSIQIRQNYPAPVGFLPDLEKVPDSGRREQKSGTALLYLLSFFPLNSSSVLNNLLKSVVLCSF